MARQVQLKRSAVQGRVPTTSDLALGEIGINTYDGKIFIKKNDGSDAIVEFRGESNVYVDVHNDTGSTIAVGVPVYVSGTHTSGKPTVALADNDGSGTYPAIGLIYESLADGDEGKVLISGIIEGLDTSSYSAGDALYLDSTAGALTSTRPTSSSTQVQKVGLVTRSHASAGSILVIGAGRANDVPNEITALTGVSLDAVNLGTFTGTTISDNGTIKAALQELETAVESGGGGVSSVNTQTGAVVLDTDDISEGATNLYSQWSDVTGGISYTGDVTITDTAADSAAGPEFSLYRNSASPDDGDYLGQIRFDGKNDNGGDQLYAKITGKTSDVSLGTEDGLIETAVVLNGSQTIVARQTGTALKLINGCGLEVNGAITTDSTVDGRDVAADGTKLDGIAAGAEVNAVDSVNTQTGAVVLDTDDISEGATNLYSQWSNGTGEIYYTGGNVGIGTSNPSRTLQAINTAGAGIVGRIESTGSRARIAFKDTNTTNDAYVGAGSAGDDLALYAGNSERIRIGSAGQIGLGGATYGTSGQVLTSNGSSSAPTWQDAGGAWTLLSTITASGASTVDFTSNIDSTYRTYVIIGSEIEASNSSTNLEMRFYVNGTLLTASEYDSNHIRVESSVNNSRTTNNSKVNLTKDTSNGIGAGISMLKLVLDNPSASKVQYMTKYEIITGSDNLAIITGAAAIEAGTAYTNVDGVQFLPASGTLDGTFKLYGIS